jgi:hypothetical protein
MKATGTPQLLHGLAMNLILLVNDDFTTWMDKTGGESHLHSILFYYFDNYYATTRVFCTDFNNENVYYTGRPAMKLDCSALTKVALTFKAANSHFDQLISLYQADSTVHSICVLIAPSPAPAHNLAEPAPRRAKVVTPPMVPQANVREGEGGLRGKPPQREKNDEAGQ